MASAGLRFTSDEEVAAVRKQLEGVNISEAVGPKGKFANFTPGSHCVVFEGGRNEDDTISFRRYHGEVHDQHRQRRCYEPFLTPSMHLSSSEDQFTQKFADQYQLIEIAHNEEEHGPLRVMGRFGKYYYIDDPPEGTMSVEKLNTLGGKQYKRGERMFRSSLIPQEMNHDALEAILSQKGYQQDSEEERYMITVNPTGGKSKISLSVVQNGSFEFEELRYPGFKWVHFNIVRKDPQMRDVRLLVESLRTTEDTNDPAVEKYKDASILYLQEGDVKVKPEFRQEVTFVRQKITRKFKKEMEEGEQGFYPEVQLSRTKEINMRGPGGQQRYQAPQWREEVVINATPLLPPDADMGGIKIFASEFLEFCFEMSAAVHA